VDVLESLEVRWFLAAGDSVLGMVGPWFASAIVERGRRDDYLWTGRRDLGIKARGVDAAPTQLEVKYLVRSLGVAEVAPGMVGHLERWTKLSLPVDAPELGRRGRWVALAKERRLRTFAFAGGLAREVRGSGRLDAGCGVELTRVVVSEEGGAPPQVCFTVGIEAFGPESTLKASLDAACRAAADSGLAVQLTSSSSMSYPEWLASSWAGRPDAT